MVYVITVQDKNTNEYKETSTLYEIYCLANYGVNNGQT